MMQTWEEELECEEENGREGGNIRVHAFCFVITYLITFVLLKEFPQHLDAKFKNSTHDVLQIDNLV